MRDRTAGFRSVTFSNVEMRSATLLQDASSILTHLESGLSALDSRPSVATSADRLGPVEGRPKS